MTVFEGVAATVLKPGGASFQVQGIFDQATPLNKPKAGITTRGKRSLLTVRQTQLSSGQTIKKGDQIKISEKTYQVRQEPESANGMVKVTLSV